MSEARMARAVLGARLRRHFRADKKLHWHIDHLTTVADGMSAIAVRDGSECGLAAVLSRSGTFRYAAERFGSSDCNSCPSHLLQWMG